MNSWQVFILILHKVEIYQNLFHSKKKIYKKSSIFSRLPTENGVMSSRLIRVWSSVKNLSGLNKCGSVHTSGLLLIHQMFPITAIPFGISQPRKNRRGKMIITINRSFFPCMALITLLSKKQKDQLSLSH